jgi:hypothetical protein
MFEETVDASATDGIDTKSTPQRYCVRISDRFLRNLTLMNLGFISSVFGIQYFHADKFNCVEFRSRGYLLRQHPCDAELYCWFGDILLTVIHCVRSVV